jgi:hypothetical protein
MKEAAQTPLALPGQIRKTRPWPARALAVVATVMPMMADGHRHDGMQLEPGHGGNDVEPDLALHAHRLEGERVEPTHEAIGANADTHRSSGGNAAISTGQRSGAHARGRREDGPGQGDIAADTDLGPETVDDRFIVLDRTAGGWREDASECTR